MCVRFLDGGGLMPRPSKPDMSPAEWLATAGMGSRKASGVVSEMRGANVGSISAKEASRRRVSHEWVDQQRRKRQKTQPSENAGGDGGAAPSENHSDTSHTGTRMGCSPTLEKTATDFLHGPVKEPGQASGKVEVSSGDVAGVQQTKTGSPANDQVVAKGGAA